LLYASSISLAARRSSRTLIALRVYAGAPTVWSPSGGAIGPFGLRGLLAFGAVRLLALAVRVLALGPVRLLRLGPVRLLPLGAVRLLPLGAALGVALDILLALAGHPERPRRDVLRDHR